MSAPISAGISHNPLDPLEQLEQLEPSGLLDSELLIPTLKPGVQFIATPDGSYIGFSHRGIEIKSLSRQEQNFVTVALALFNGRRSIAKIATALSSHFDRLVLQSEITSLIEHLTEANLLEVQPIEANSQTRSGKVIAQNQLNFESRLTPETNLLAWQLNKTSSSRTSVLERAKFSILVFGSNRLALSIYSLLQASGFSSTKLIDRARPINEISADLVCGASIKTSDIGLKTRELLAELKRNSQLNFVDELPFPAVPSFIIATSATQPDYIQRWLSEAIPHLLIGNPIESRIEIGPIVIPGKSPCLQCLELWRSEQNPNYQKLNLITSLTPPLEISAGSVSVIAGLAALQICEFASTWHSKLIGAVAKFDLLNPFSPEMEYWQPHKDCGCQYQ